MLTRSQIACPSFSARSRGAAWPVLIRANWHISHARARHERLLGNCTKLQAELKYLECTAGLIKPERVFKLALPKQADPLRPPCEGIRSPSLGQRLCHPSFAGALTLCYR